MLLVERPLVLKPPRPPGLLAGPGHRHLYLPTSQPPPPLLSLPRRRPRKLPQEHRWRCRPASVGIELVTVLGQGGKYRRHFHSTSSRADEAIDNSRNHYETLKVHPRASPAEIKKAFYTLSKTHHPDAHAHRSSSTSPSSQRFMRISEAYSILSIPARRAAYDRDVLRLQPPPSPTPSHHTGSYSSTNSPAGGRPASGLSRRRSTFQGPPPSFYRSGGWGAHTGKRRAAHEESTGTRANATSSGRGTVGGMGPGQDPFGHRDDVPHFDREAHERTGQNVDRRRAERQREREEAAAANPARGPDGDPTSQRYHHHRGPTGTGEGLSPAGPEKGIGGMFFVVGGIVLLSIFGPWAISSVWSGSGNGGGRGGEAKAARATKRRSRDREKEKEEEV
ncbi:hypothetical protein F5X96DRAFT_613495, partial [Biscogniauxia mediterranea]